MLHVRLSDFKWDSRFAWEHIRMGLPMAVQFSVLGLGMIIIQAICNQFGSETIAAFTSSMRIEQLALQPMISFGLAMAVYTGQNFGAHDKPRRKEMLAAIAGFQLVCGGYNVFLRAGNDWHLSG